MDKVERFLDFILSPSSKGRSSNIFNKALNSKLRANYHVIDLSEKTLLQHNFNQKDTDTIREAYFSLKDTFRKWDGVEIKGDYIRVVSGIIYEGEARAKGVRKHEYPNPYIATKLIINKIMRKASSIRSTKGTRLRIGKELIRSHIAGGESFRLRAAYRINAIEKISKTPFHREFKKQLYGHIGILTKYRENIEKFVHSGEKFNIVITLEHKTTNATKAVDEQKMSSDILKNVAKAFEYAIDITGPNKFRRLLMARESPSFIDKLIAKFATVFLQRTNKLYNFYNRIFRSKRKPKTYKVPDKPIYLESSYNKLYQVENTAPDEEVDLLTLKFLLNKELPPAVIKRMGKSTDPPIKLRHQTGRFAYSSEIVNITSTRRDRIDIFYTYMHYPYDVFLPGHRLNPPAERDPRPIIDQAIRDISKDIISSKFNINTEMV